MTGEPGTRVHLAELGQKWPLPWLLNDLSPTLGISLRYFWWGGGALSGAQEAQGLFWKYLGGGYAVLWWKNRGWNRAAPFLPSQLYMTDTKVTIRTP